MSVNFEFSRRVPLDRIGARPAAHEIAATESERAALAERFGLLGIDSLTATVTLARARAGQAVELSARLQAAVVQVCVVTLEPVPARLDESFTILYLAMSDADEDLDPDPEGPVLEPLPPDAIDIGEAVAQELALALDPFPRTPDAKIPSDGFDAPDDRALTSPFAALARTPSKRS